MNPEIRTLSVGALTRVEGEGALHVTLNDGVVESVELNIYEPPRFFEAFLRGRAYTEPPDITARVCGICPVAYQISASNAIEDACGVTVPRSWWHCAGCCTAVNGSTVTPCTSICCTHRISSAIRTSSAWPRTPDLMERGLRSRRRATG